MAFISQPTPYHRKVGDGVGGKKAPQDTFNTRLVYTLPSKVFSRLIFYIVFATNPCVSLAEKWRNPLFKAELNAVELFQASIGYL